VKDQYLSIQSSERILNLYKTTLIPQAQLSEAATASVSASKTFSRRNPASAPAAINIGAEGNGRPICSANTPTNTTM
jgi:hypothetical protein